MMILAAVVGEFTLPHIKVIPIHTKQREKD